MMVDIGGENGSIEPQEKSIENVFEFTTRRRRNHGDP